MPRRKLVSAALLLAPPGLAVLLCLALAAATPLPAVAQGLAPARGALAEAGLAQAGPATPTGATSDGVLIITSPLSVTSPLTAPLTAPLTPGLAAPLTPGLTLTDAVQLGAPEPVTLAVGAEAAVLAPAPGPAFRLTSMGDELTIDPLLITVQGGGAVAANSVLPGCAGYVPVSPTVTLDFTGTAPLLRTFFFSDGDSTLGVRAPDGTYRCGDDINDLILDAAVDIAEPQPGRYDVWVGSKVATDRIPGFLVFTTRAEVDAGSFSPASLVQRPAGPGAVAARERVVAAALRVQDALAGIEAATPITPGSLPVTQTFAVEGSLPAAELNGGDTLCGGLVSITPTLAFDWSGPALPLTVYAEADGDTTLLVRAADGTLRCADDADPAANLNPVLTLAAPVNGRYLVWVGRVASDRPAVGTLTVTAAPGVPPQPLAKP